MRRDDLIDSDNEDELLETGDRYDANRLMHNVVYDLIPSDDFGRVVSHLPRGATIAITLSPEKGVGPTLEKTEYAVSRGFDTIPHIAARFVRDYEHLNEIAERLTQMGISEIFVPGGDRPEPVGEFASAFELLSALDELGFSFDDVGITGYPNGHDVISTETMYDETKKKLPFATYIGTQLSIDPDSITSWITDTRSEEIGLPVEVGIPGAVNYPRLMKMSWQWGAVKPLQFLRKTTGVSGFFLELLKARGRYTPDELIDTLEQRNRDDRLNIYRLRLLTFNQTRDTVRWHQSRVHRLQG